MSNQFFKKKVLVIGLGMSGKSAARFLCAKGAQVIGVDRNPEKVGSLPEVTVLNDDASLDFSDISLVVLSPGVSPTHPLCNLARERGIEVIGEIELGARSIHQPCIGITGTNGKTTVTLLVEHVLNRSGIPAVALGNVGVPFTEEILKPENQKKILVLELSSFQLETLNTPLLDAAAILNITLDHLDRYPSMKEYAEAKLRIKSCLKPGKWIFIHERALNQYGSHLDRTFLQSYSDSSFEKENEQAAFLLCQTFGITKKQFEEALPSFRKPPHRLEYVCDIKGISYYNDSKGTNVDAVIRAVEKLSCRIVLIAGGIGKGAIFSEWIRPFANKVFAICAFGQDAKKIYEEISEHIPVTLCRNLEHAVEQASLIAKQGDTVLLSPGCASLDMFRNYAERGELFKSLVEKMRKTRAF